MGELQRGGSVRGHVNRVSGSLQTSTEKVRNSFLVFNNEDAHVLLGYIRREFVTFITKAIKSAPLLLLGCLLLSAQKGAPSWNLTFSDEFNGPELDLAKWVPHEPMASAQVYEPGWVEVSGGQLHITAHPGKPNMVTTFGIFAQTYGRFEVRCRIPAGRGLRSRFRLLPVPLGPLPEIDVFETEGSAPAKVFFGNKWGTEQTERSFGDSFAAPDLSAAFHVIAVEWDPDRIAWFVDGKKRFESVDGVPRQAMFPALDLAAAGSTGLSPASFDVDYIRVYQRR